MKKYLPKSEYAKNSIISIVGVALASLIPLLIRPFLGRIFTPEEFNTMGLYITLVSVLAIAANFRYGYAVAIAKSDDDAKNALMASIVLSLLFSILVFVVLLLFGAFILQFLELDNSLSYWFYFVPISVFITSSCIGLNGWLNRKKSYTAMAVNKSVRRGGEGFFQLLFGKIKLTGGLLYGVILGDLLNFITHFFQFKRAEGNFKNVNSTSIKKVLRTYIDFPKYNLIPSLLDTLSLMLPFIIINGYYSKEISGQFYQSRDLLALPLVLVSTALSQVLLQRLSEHRANQKVIMPLLIRHIYFLATLGFLGVLILIPFGEDLFVIFVGDQWGMAGTMAAIMVISYAFKFVVTPLSVIFFSLEKVKISGYWQVAYFLGISSLLLIKTDDIYSFIRYYVIIEVAFYAIYLLLIISLAKKYDKELK